MEDKKISSIEDKLFNDALKTTFRNWDKYNNVNFLTKTLGVEIVGTADYLRIAANTVNSMNKDGLKYMIATLPCFCSGPYMIIKFIDRLKAAEIGLQLMYV